MKASSFLRLEKLYHLHAILSDSYLGFRIVQLFFMCTGEICSSCSLLFGQHDAKLCTKANRSRLTKKPSGKLSRQR